MFLGSCSKLMVTIHTESHGNFKKMRWYSFDHSKKYFLNNVEAGPGHTYWCNSRLKLRPAFGPLMIFFFFLICFIKINLKEL